MKIYFITDVDLNKPSGRRTHVLELARNLARLGVNICLFYPCYKKFTLPPGKVNWVPIQAPRHRHLFGKVFQAQLLWKLSHFGRPDVVYMRLSGGMIVPALWAKINTIALFVEVNGSVSLEYSLPWSAHQIPLSQRIRLRRVRAIERFNLRQARGIIFASEPLKTYYAKQYRLPAEKLTVIHNGADVTRFCPMSKSDARRDLGLSTNDIILGFVGGLAPWQGLDVVLQALHLVRNSGMHLRFYIIGDGTERQCLEELCASLGLQEDVVFVGAVNSEEVPLYINAFDIALAPYNPMNTKILGSPLKLYEYMACARPVVITGVTPGADIVEKLGAGILAEAGSAESLAEAIQMLVQMEREWEKMGLRGRAYVQENADWQQIAQRVLDFVESRL